jgi:hypothetical protein
VNEHETADLSRVVLNGAPEDIRKQLDSFDVPPPVGMPAPMSFTTPPQLTMPVAPADAQGTPATD